MEDYKDNKIDMHENVFFEHLESQNVDSKESVLYACGGIKTSSKMSLIDTYHVVIPLIQRDYAQGRISHEVRQVRSGFLQALFSNLDAGTQLDAYVGRNSVSCIGQNQSLTSSLT